MTTLTLALFGNAVGLTFMSVLWYCKDTEPLYHSFIYSLVSLLSGIYPLPAMHSLLVTLLTIVLLTLRLEVQSSSI